MAHWDPVSLWGAQGHGVLRPHRLLILRLLGLPSPEKLKPCLMLEVAAERAAEYMLRGNRADTPTLVDRGKAAFRSQVILHFFSPAPPASCNGPLTAIEPDAFSHCQQ